MGILDKYLEFTEGTEPPPQYHRWSFLNCAAACLGRKVWIPFGHGLIYPNLFTLLVGVPGTRKSSAIVLAKKMLGRSNYHYFSYAKTTKQKFLLDLEEGMLPKADNGKVDFAKILDMNIETAEDGPADAESFICCDEFVDFIGINNIEFINLLTTLWDNPSHYDERLKNSKSVRIHNPTLNLLGGITQTSFAQAMPAEVVGQGFLSRLILVYGEPGDKKITWPRVPDPAEYTVFEDTFKRLQKYRGEVIITGGARQLVDHIYQHWENLDDVRLQYYGARRLTHLLKLAIVIAALNASTNELLISNDTIIEANTILSYTEVNMHNALGEFGKSKNSDASQKIMEVLSQARGPLHVEDLWKSVSNDLDRFQTLVEVIQNLQRASKIITKLGNDGKMTIMIRRKQVRDISGTTDFHKYIKEYKHRDILTVKSSPDELEGTALDFLRGQ